ncbi:MAG: hypothetical protein ACRDJ2_01560 [Actinomycetota bacterium]
MTLDRSGLWSELLIGLTRASPARAVSGNVEEGLAGEGDVDLVAPQADWMAVEEEFRRWAGGNHLDPVISCPHRPGVLLLVAVGKPGTPVYKLEVLGHRHFRGARMYSAEDLVPAMEMDPRGWRRLRPGATALIKLVPNGVTWSGGLKWTGPKAARVLGLLEQDREGAHLAAKAFGSMGRLVESAARDARAGRWPRARMLALEGRALVRGLLSPAHALSRLRYRSSPAARCELPLTLRRRGLVLDDLAQVRRLAESHEGVSGRVLGWE